jgi:hypothetical protein
MTPLLDESLMRERRGADLRRARLGVALGLLFLAGPLSDLLKESYSAPHLIVLLAGLALFVGLYVSLLPPAGWLRRLGPGALGAALALLPVIAVAMLAALLSSCISWPRPGFSCRRRSRSPQWRRRLPESPSPES